MVQLSAEYIEGAETVTPTTTTRHLRTPLDGIIRRVAKRFGGENFKELERFLRFAVVGLTGAVIDLGLLTTLQLTVLPPAGFAPSSLDFNLSGLPFNYNLTAIPLDFNVALATTLAFISAVVSNFFWTTKWVYPESRSNKRRQLMQFVFISVVGWLARTLWITLMYVSLGSLFAPLAEPMIQIINSGFELTPVTEKSIGSIAAQLIAMVFVMLWNFFANRYWTFNDVD